MIFMAPLKIGVIGYGCRGRSITKSVLLKSPQYEVAAICDEYEDRTAQGVADVEKAGGATPFASTNYHDVLSCGGLDAVYIATSWETHVRIAIETMKKGIPVAVEVGGAYSVEELWEMVTRRSAREPP